MKKKIFRWLKFIGLLAAAAVCLCGFLFGLSEAVSDYSIWQDSFHSAERLCKHVDSFFLSVNILILFGGFLLLSIDGILRLFRKSERSPSPLWQRIQIYIVCFSLVVFVILRLWSRDAAARMGTTIEDGDASYRLHLLCGWLDLGQLLAFWGIQKLIVDSNGNIRNFPGFVQEDLWVSQVDPCYLKPLIRFRGCFSW